MGAALDVEHRQVIDVGGSRSGSFDRLFDDLYEVIEARLLEARLHAGRIGYL